MAGAARKTDTIGPPKHSGSIVMGSPDATTDNLPDARESDIVVCRKHGPNMIVSGSTSTLTNNLPSARMGDKCGCRATITSGSTTRTID